MTERDLPAMRRGVSPGWESTAERIYARTGRRLSLDPVPDGFARGPQDVEVRLDDDLLGDFACEWPETQPADETLAGLREQLAWFLDELFRTAGSERISAVTACP